MPSEAIQKTHSLPTPGEVWRFTNYDGQLVDALVVGVIHPTPSGSLGLPAGVYLAVPLDAHHVFSWTTDHYRRTLPTPRAIRLDEWPLPGSRRLK